MTSWRYLLSIEEIAWLGGLFGLIAALFFLFRPKLSNKTSKISLAALAALGFLLIYPSDYIFGVRPFFHQWEQYHLFVSAKYFPELGYEEFYNCARQADQEDAPDRWTKPQLMRNLVTKRLSYSNEALATVDCKQLFTTERWTDYKKDIAYFAASNEQLREGRWMQTFTDYGTNVTPAWAGFYHSISNFFPAASTFLILLSFFDLFLFLASLALIKKGWGWERLQYVLIFLGANEGARAGWLLGSVFRFEWLFLLILSLYWLQQNQSMKSYVAVSISNLFRPVTALATYSPFVLLIKQRQWKKLIAGSLIAGSALMLLTFANGRGLSSWMEYATNSEKYLQSFLQNDVGLKPLLVNLSPDERLKRLPEILQKYPNLAKLDFPRANELAYLSIMNDSAGEHKVGLIISLIILLSATVMAIWRFLPVDGMIFSSVFSLFLISPPAYYTLALMVLMIRSQISRWVLAATFALLALTKILPTLWDQDSLTYKVLSALLLAIVLIHFIDNAKTRLKAKDA